ncbi:MAG: BatA domain-containing protein [Chloroherpetonaceae bacterium]|nr:BatA domain-containing protein [Chloroherpetonaceae bacterium]
MIFLNPAMLFGLLAASLPILLHLLNLRRRTQLEFSSLVLLRQLEQSALQRFKVRQWLLLLIRSLVVFFLVSSFSKPIVPGYLAGSSFGTHTKTSAVIVLDNSPSMGYSDPRGGDQWKQARAAALKILEHFSEQDEIFLSIGHHTKPERLALSEAKRQIATAELSALPFSAEESLLHAMSALATSQHFNREVYVISDFQPSDFLRRDSSRQYQYNFDFKLYAVSVAASRKQNAALTNAELLTKILEPNKPVRVEATLQQFGVSSSQTESVSLWLAGKLSAETAVELPANRSTSAVLTATPTQQGFLSGELRIENDALEADNHRYFTFFVPEKLRVLIAYRNEADARFLRLALESLQNKDFFELTLVPEPALDAQDFSKFDVLMLCGIGTVSSSAVARIQQFVQQGGGLVVFARPESPEFGALNAVLTPMNAGQLIPMPSVSQAAPLSIEQIDYRHPLFEGVFQSDISRRKAQSAAIEEPFLLYAAAEILPTGQSEAVMRSATGKAFLTVTRYQSGLVLLFAALPKPEHTSLVLQPLFAPLMFRAALYSSAKAHSRNYQFTCGELSEVSVPVLAGEEALVRKPSGKFFFASLNRRHSESRLLLEPSVFNEVGIYEVFSRKGLDTVLVMKLAFNIATSESDVQTLSPDMIYRFANLVALEKRNFFFTSVAERLEEVDSMLQNSRYGFGIWKILLALAAIGLLAESILGRRDTA